MYGGLRNGLEMSSSGPSQHDRQRCPLSRTPPPSHSPLPSITHHITPFIIGKTVNHPSSEYQTVKEKLRGALSESSFTLSPRWTSSSFIPFRQGNHQQAPTNTSTQQPVINLWTSQGVALSLSRSSPSLSGFKGIDCKVVYRNSDSVAISSEPFPPRSPPRPRSLHYPAPSSPPLRSKRPDFQGKHPLVSVQSIFYTASRPMLILTSRCGPRFASRTLRVTTEVQHNAITSR